MEADPFFVDEGDLDAARALVESAEHADLFLYPGDQHLFADDSLPSYDANAAALLSRRVLDFLGTRCRESVDGRRRLGVRCLAGAVGNVVGTGGALSRDRWR